MTKENVVTPSPKLNRFQIIVILAGVVSALVTMADVDTIREAVVAFAKDLDNEIAKFKGRPKTS